MLVLNSDELKPGMILAKPVRNFQEVLLLNEGTELSKKNIRMLKSWGVVEIRVEGGDDEDEGRDVELNGKLKESIERELKEKFSEVLEDEIMVEIMRVAAGQLEKRFLCSSTS
jgi:hypothetical protein